MVIVSEAVSAVCYSTTSRFRRSCVCAPPSFYCITSLSAVVSETMATASTNLPQHEPLRAFSVFVLRGLTLALDVSCGFLWVHGYRKRPK